MMLSSLLLGESTSDTRVVLETSNCLPVALGDKLAAWFNLLELSK